MNIGCSPLTIFKLDKQWSAVCRLCEKALQRPDYKFGGMVRGEPQMYDLGSQKVALDVGFAHLGKHHNGLRTTRGYKE